MERSADIEQLNLSWNMAAGRIGVDSSPDNPLWRAMEALLERGKPLGRFTKCFVQTPDGILRWLGVFHHSVGDRVLFYPGFATPLMHIVGYNHSTPRWNQPFHLDHVSLERDRKSWHLTAPKSKEHIGKLGVRPLGDGRIHWFSMSIAAPRFLREAWQTTLARGRAPTHDIDRRVESFGAARDCAEFQLLTLNETSPLPAAPWFLHFTVVVVPTDFPTPHDEPIALPSKGPFVQPHSIEGPLPYRYYRISISETVHLDVTVAAIRGTVENTPIAFSSAVRG